MRPDGGLAVRFWGARGSVPVPGPSTLKYGGNTPCVEVRTPVGGSLIFDAGTGIRLLGRSATGIGSRGGEGPIQIFLTHYHWDHIQGLPFFSPLRDPGARVVVHGFRQGQRGVEDLLRTQTDPVFFPVPYARLPASMECRDLGPDPWVEDGVEVASIQVRHPGHTVGFRVRTHQGAVAYVPDNELGEDPGGGYGASAPPFEALRRFLEGVDLLIHDAMFTDAEYPSRQGWGHSSVGQAVRLAEEAGVGTLCLFHHAPGRADAEMDEILEGARRDVARRGSPLQVDAAREGDVWALGASGAR